jgi:hypothetical protein
MPICAHATPMTLMIAVECAQTVQVHTNAPEPSPPPLGAAMQMVVVMVASIQPPNASDIVPDTTVPPLIHGQLILMTPGSTVVSGQVPAWALVVMIAPPKVPI